MKMIKSLEPDYYDLILWLLVEELRMRGVKAESIRLFVKAKGNKTIYKLEHKLEVIDEQED